MNKRPDFIKHWTDIQDKDDAHYPESVELLSIDSPFSQKMGLKKLGIHHEVLLPGRRTSWPHAHSDEEEFAYVIEGNPDVWINGNLYFLSPGDGVAFPAGTGIAHTFINNTQDNLRLLVIGERSKLDSKVYYPMHPEFEKKRKDWWQDCPQQEMGSHDGFPDENDK